MKGNNKKVTDECIEILLTTIETEPKELGYEFGRWTAARLATYLEIVTGIKLSGSQVRRILKAKKYVYLWAKYSLESQRNEVKRDAFKQKIQEYLQIEKETPDRLHIWFWDESGFSLRVIRRKNWHKKGSPRKVRGDRRKGRVNVMGAVRYSAQKRFVDFLSKSNSESFYHVL
jgi:hypothetical protein